MELQEKYNSLFKESMDKDLSDSEVRRKLEQMKGIGYATGLVDALIFTMSEEVDFREEEKAE